MERFGLIQQIPNLARLYQTELRVNSCQLVVRDEWTAHRAVATTTAQHFDPRYPGAERADSIKLSKSVVYVDADGKTLDSPALTKDQKVRVHYMKTAGENVADRVILIKE